MHGVVQPDVALRQHEMMTICPAMATSASQGGAEANVGERAEAPAREGHAGQAQHEEDADEHLGPSNRLRHAAA